MIRDFADRRGGGVLFLAGRFALSDGAYAKTPMAEMMPLRLTAEKTWSRDFATATLTDAGRESVICRIEEERDQNIARWQKMPQVANYAVMGDAQARRGGADECGRSRASSDAAAGDSELRPRARGRVRDGGQLALEDAAGSHGPDAFDVLVAAAALDGDGNAGTGSVVYSASGVAGRHACSAARERARQELRDGIRSDGADHDLAARWRFGRGGVEAGSAGAGDVHGRIYGGQSRAPTWRRRPRGRTRPNWAGMR